MRIHQVRSTTTRNPHVSLRPGLELRVSRGAATTSRRRPTSRGVSTTGGSPRGVRVRLTRAPVRARPRIAEAPPERGPRSRSSKRRAERETVAASIAILPHPAPAAATTSTQDKRGSDQLPAPEPSTRRAFA
jgi:hypothetical protein